MSPRTAVPRALAVLVVLASLAGCGGSGRGRAAEAASRDAVPVTTSGLVTDERFRGHHFTDRLVTEVAYALEQRGDAHVILFETLDENVGFLPELIEAGVAATGYGRLAFEPVGVQVHRAWELP